MALRSKWPDVQIPENLSWSEYVLQNAEKYSERIAIVDSNNVRSYTYKQLKDLVHKFGAGIAKRGFKKGDVFGIVCPNMPDFPVIYYGVISIGGIATAMNPLYTSEEIAHQLKDSAAKWVITLQPFAEKVKEAALKVGVENVCVIGEADDCQSFSEILEEDVNVVKVDINLRDDLAALPYSSGTTGLPKGVMLSHYNLIADSCISIGKDFTYYDDSVACLAVLPFFHSFATMINLANILVQGGKVVCMMHFEQEAFLKAIQDHKITNTSLVPPIILFLAKHPMIDQYDLSSLVDITCGAAPLGQELGKQLVDRLPNLKWFRQGYGMTELCPACHVTPLVDNDNYGSVGVLLPNLECKVVDTLSGETLSKGSDGEICVRGPIVMKGYLNNESATKNTIDSEGWYHTGDIGHYDDEEYFYIVDRLKEIIKYKGLQVAPAELEAILLSHSEVQDAAVIGIPDEEVGEVPKAFVVRKGEELTAETLADFVHEKVAPYKKLRGGIVFIDKIPKSVSGKILRRELKNKELVQFPQLQKIVLTRDANILKSKYPDVEIPESTSWAKFVMMHFDSYGDKLALTDVKGERSYTYRQLKDFINRTSSALIKIGMKRGDVLCLYCPNVPEFAIIYLATIQAGGVVTASNPLYTEDELSHQLELSNAKYLVTTPQLTHRARGGAQANGITQLYVIGKSDGFMSISTLFEDDGSSLEEVVINAKEDPVILPFSSGTTGLPKGVELTHYNLVADATIATTDGFIEYLKSSVLLGFLPFFHTYGLVTVLSIGLRYGSTIVCVPKFEREIFLSILQDHKITHVALVPSIAMMVAKDPSVQKYDLSSLCEVTSGAAVLGEDISKEVLKKLPHLKGIRQGYGMTELSPVSHMTVASSTKHGTVGHLLPNLECKVVDVSSGETVGAGIDGEICVRGPIVMKGYLNNSEATRNCIDNDNWLHTGDVGHYDQDDCFYIVDRVKELIKYKGYQVPPAELESLLVSHPIINDAAVVGIPDNEAGEVPMAYVVTNGIISKDDIIKFVEENVAPYKKLRGGVQFVDEIPRSLSGKILRRQLKDRLKQLKRVQIKENSSTSRRNTAAAVSRECESVVNPRTVKNSSCCLIL